MTTERTTQSGDRPSIADLRSQVSGRVLVPEDAGFEDACQGFNLATVHRPEVVVAATSTSDVSAAVRFAVATGATVHVHATGHGMGVPAHDGVLITTGGMRDVIVDPEGRRARVGAGAHVIEASVPHGLAPLNGSSTTVGVVGYTLGGGWGPMGRTFGFAADHVRRLELVTADGAIIDVHADSEPELFWGLRGGKIDVGIVTELEFDLMEVSHFFGGAIFYPGEAADVVMHAFATWALTLPEESTASIAILRLPDIEGMPAPLRGQTVVHLRFVHIGDDAHGEAVLEPMRRVSAPLIDLVERTPYAAIGSVHQDPDTPMPAWDAGILLREFPAQAVDALLAVAGPDVEVPLIMAEIRHLGGVAGRQAHVPNAVGSRDAAFSLEVVGPFPPGMQDAVVASGMAVLEALAPWANGRTAINFQGADTVPEHVRHAWPQETLTRLNDLKRAWDPGAVFRFGYSIVD